MASNDLKRSTPEEQGIPSSAILEFIEAVEQSEQELHSFMLLKNDAVVAEGWWSPYGQDIPHLMFSLSKSFTSTAVGMAIDDGLFSVDDTVLSFFPDEAPDHVSDYLASMRVKHLLTMATGHDVKTFPFMYSREDNNWAKGFFEVPIPYEPGTFFFYNSGASYMLSEIVQRKTGKNLMEYLTPRLFEPLGIEGAYWQTSPQGVQLGAIGLSLKTEDIARFGQLYLHKGMWQGKRLLSEAWIEEATAKQVSNGSDPQSDWEQGYGYQFWRSKHGLYRGDGAFGQFCIVMDAYNAVLAVTSAVQDMQIVMNLVWDILLPALDSDTAIESGEDYQRLTEKLANLHIDPIEAQSVSPLAEQVSGVVYNADQNALGIEQFSLNFTDSGCVFTFDDESITAGYGAWHKDEATIFNEIWLEGKIPLVACGTWLSDTGFRLVTRLYETPYVYTFDFEFDGDNVHLTVQINVSLISTEPTHITASKS